LSDWQPLAVEKTTMNPFNHLTQYVKDFFEARAFGVCTYLGERFNLSIHKVRNIFIYLSFLSFGSPVVVYMIVAFWLDLKSYIRRKSIIWD
jgi:phage shock protein PspC (stress-responsive transcriptional regulator)